MNFTINIRLSKIVKFLAYLSFGFLLAGIVSHSLKYNFNQLPNLHRWFNTDGEKNFPAAFSSGLFLFSSLLTAVITAYKISYKDTFTNYWAGLSVVFCLLAADEWLSFHEKLSDIILLKLPVSGIFHFAWVLGGIAFLAFFGLIYIRFLLHLPRYYRQWFLIAAITFIIGAIGMEMVSGYYVDSHQQWNRNIWLTLTTIEEGLEMSGLIICIGTLLNYIQKFIGNIHLCLGPHSQLQSPPHSPIYPNQTKPIKQPSHQTTN